MNPEEPTPSEKAPLLQVSGLSVERRVLFGDSHIALRDISFEIQPGEIAVFCGESGCGKSTLTRAIVRFLNPGTKLIQGTIRLDGIDLLALGRREMRRIRCQRIGFVDRAVGCQLNPDISVKQHLRETLQLAGRSGELGDEKDWGPFFYEVGIVEPELVLQQRSRALPPLMIQRIMLLTALFSGADLLICDEPTVELDSVAARCFYEVLRQLRDERKLGILLTSGQLRGLDQIADQIHVMCEGGILESGGGREFFQKCQFDYTKQFLQCTPDIHQCPGRLPLISRESAGEAERAVHEKSSAMKSPQSDLAEPK